MIFFANNLPLILWYPFIDKFFNLILSLIRDGLFSWSNPSTKYKENESFFFCIINRENKQKQSGNSVEVNSWLIDEKSTNNKKKTDSSRIPGMERHE